MSEIEEQDKVIYIPIFKFVIHDTRYLRRKIRNQYFDRFGDYFPQCASRQNIGRY